MQDGKLYRRQKWELRIREIGCGSWQTPSVEDAGRKGSPQAWLEYLENGRTTQCRLRNQVYYPTPTKQDAENNGGPSQYRRNTPPLNAAVKSWPTPSAACSTGGNSGLAGGQGNRLKLYKMLGKEEGKKLGCQSLNPNWVEWLMGWPIGWTDLRPLGMDRLALWLQQHSAFFQED